MKNVSAEIQQGISQKTGKPYNFITFKIKTSQGVWSSQPCFPTPLEFNLVSNALATPSTDDHSDELDNILDFEN